MSEVVSVMVVAKSSSSSSTPPLLGLACFFLAISKLPKFSPEKEELQNCKFPNISSSSSGWSCTNSGDFFGSKLLCQWPESNSFLARQPQWNFCHQSIINCSPSLSLSLAVTCVNSFFLFEEAALERW
jgi:hypothetical protein